VERAAVPAAAVDEDGSALRPEDDVGFHAKRLHLQPCNFPLERRASPPAGVTVGAQESAIRSSSVAQLPCERMADITTERFRLVTMSVTD